MEDEKEKESRSYHWQSPADGSCEIDRQPRKRLPSERRQWQPAIDKRGVGGGRNDGRTRVKEDRRRVQS